MKKVIRFISSEKLLRNESLFSLYDDIKVEFILYSDLIYISWKWLYHKNKWFLNQIDLAWITWNKYLDFKRWITYFLSEYKNTKIVDTKLKYMLDDSKFSQIVFLDNSWFSIPKTLFLYLQSDYIDLIEKELGYPLIFKDIYLDRWEWVFIIKNKKELENFIKENIDKPYIIQEFIENNWDWRVLVVKDSVIWWFKRYSEKSFKNNFSQWWDIFFDDVPSILKEKAIQICKWYNIEIWWIDFFYENWIYYVIEINRVPQTNAFKKKFGNLYEKKVLDMFKGLISE